LAIPFASRNASQVDACLVLVLLNYISNSAVALFFLFLSQVLLNPAKPPSAMMEGTPGLRKLSNLLYMSFSNPDASTLSPFDD